MSGINAVVFESAGQRSEHVLPGAYSRSQSVPASSGGVTAGNGIIMGKSTGGKPLEMYAFSTLQEAKDKLVAGELLDGVSHALTPGGNYAPQKIYAMRVNGGTQSESVLKTGANSILKLTAWDYGPHTNQLKRQISTGTASGSKKIVFSYKDNTVTKDNIIRNSFSLIYTGSGTAAVCSVDKTGLTTTVTGADADNLSIPFTDFPYLSDVIKKINDTTVYTAVLLDASDNVSAATLDFKSGIDIKASAYTFTSNLQALIEAIQSVPYIDSVTLVDGSPRTVPDDDAAPVYFTGGASGEYTVEQWNAALAVLEKKDIQIIGTPCTDSAVHILIRNHCIAMSNIQNRKERTYILGGPIGESQDEAKAKAAIQATKYGSYCYPYINSTDPLTGKAVTLAASYFACKLVGMESCLAVNMPLTNKDVDVTSWGEDLTTTEMEALIKAGVLVGGKSDDGRFVVMRAMTTNQGSNLQDCERSMVREDLYMNRDLRQRYAAGIGNPDIGGTGNDLSVLNRAARDWKESGYIQDKIWGQKITKEGDATYVSFSRYLTPPKNFYFITASNYVYSSSATTVSV